MNSSVSLLSSSVAISISKRSSKWAKPIIYPKPSCLCLSAKPRTTTSFTTTLVSSDESTDNLVLIKSSKKRINNIVIRSNKKEKEAEMKERWLDSLSTSSLSSTSSWVVGVDPDVSGAIALLKPVFVDDDGGHNPPAFSAQVFDSPRVTILIGNRSRRRLDAKSIVNLLKSFDAPIGTTAYVEQSTPFPQDGKQGWWSGGFGYGLWIGTLVASGFSVVPVPSVAWKNKFCLSGSRSSKDDSRELASTLFPTICPLLKRKKDHGRAEALLIAAYGSGINLSTDLQGITEDLIVT